MNDDLRYKAQVTNTKRSDIVRLSQNYPVLHHALNYWHLGEITYEEALQLALVTVLARYDKLEADFQAHLDSCVKPVRIDE